MDFSDYFDKILFSIGGIDISVIILIAILSITALLFGLGLFIHRKLPKYFENGTFSPKLKTRTTWSIGLSLVLIWLISFIFLLNLDFTLYHNESDTIDLSLSSLLGIGLFLLLAQLADLLISTALSVTYNKRQKVLKGASADLQPSHIKIKRLVRPIVYILLILFFVYKFEALNFDPSFNNTWFNLKLSNILTAILIFLSARLLIWVLTKLVLSSYYSKKNINIGSRYAVNQLLKYFIFTITGFAIIESLGIQLTLIWGGAAALLVGVGLGLQQTFNDLTCGFILLFERTVELGDVVEFDNMIGIVKKIGVRTSIIETRDNITVIVPNSKLVGDYVINWSHYRERSRFKLKVGVAYGSDIELVKELLMQLIENNDKVLQRPQPFVRFASFGDSALELELHFWSRHLMGIEDVKSDMRFKIYSLFEENKVTIPFPQRDVWIRKEE